MAILIIGGSSGSSAVGNHVADISTGNGHGSTNTMIRRFSTSVEEAGTAITYADSAANGGSFTINEAGMYAITYTDLGSATGFFGISINSSQLTTAINGITAANRLASSSTAVNSQFFCVSVVARLAASDVIRAHTGGNQDSVSAIVRFTIRKIGAA